MKKIIFILTLIETIHIKAQTTWGDSLTVSASATIQVLPAEIQLFWEADADAASFKVYRKDLSETSWDLLEEIDGSSSGYVDATVLENNLYDYKITMTSSSSPTKYGYVTSGIQVNHGFNKGICIIVTEDSYISEPDFLEAYEIFKQDIAADGWLVKELFVNADDSVSGVKEQITTIYNENPESTHSLLLVGHVPVPYSGNLNPDGHPDHQGAWPTDMFYADIEGTWTDVSVNSTVSGNSKNHNVPGDGKYDQSYLPGEVVLQTGRIDFFDLPSFEKTEKQLLVAYMQKNHAFKINQFTTSDKAIIDDNFISYSEGFSQNGYRNFAPLLNRENIFNNDYFTEMSYYTGSGETYLWSYGCGGGWYQGASGVGDTYSLSIDSLNTVFTMLFGSYFGDWDNTDNFLRAALAQGNTLTNCWAGRPNWHFYAMGMGKNIGYCAQLTQNNLSTYFSSTYPGFNKMVSINLLGDPTLRMHYVMPPSNLVANVPVEAPFQVDLSWDTSSDENVIGYNVYRKHTDSILYVKRNSDLLTTAYFTDYTTESGDYDYMVTAAELKITPSGTYYNESLGISTQATLSYINISAQLAGNFSIYPNPVVEKLSINLFTEEETFYQISTIKNEVFETGMFQQAKNVLQVSSLPQGVFIITLTNSRGSTAKRFLKI
ncbi:MAG: T9SS type A sorting domain-containing protein [Chitinophagales bacterium]